MLRKAQCSFCPQQIAFSNRIYPIGGNIMVHWIIKNRINVENETINFSVMFFDLFVRLCVLSSVFVFTFCHCVLCHLFCNLFVPLCVMSSVIVCFNISFGDICVIVCYVINFCDLFVTGCPRSVPGIPSRVHRAGESAQGRQARRLVTH